MFGEGVYEEDTGTWKKTSRHILTISTGAADLKKNYKGPVAKLKKKISKSQKKKGQGKLKI